MSMADIKKVREAEAAAAATRKKGEDDAAQLIVDSKRQANDLLDSAKRDADKAYKAAIAKAEEQATKLYDEIIAKEQKACEKIKESGQKKLDGVVDDIVRKVVSN